MGETLSENEAVVERWANGLAMGMTGLDGLLSPNARIWHSTDGEWLSKDVAQQRMEDSMPVGTDRPTFRNVRSLPTTKGGVVQGTIEPVPGVAVHIVQVLTIEAGQITVLEEYVAAQSVTSEPLL